MSVNNDYTTGKFDCYHDGVDISFDTDIEEDDVIGAFAEEHGEFQFDKLLEELRELYYEVDCFTEKLRLSEGSSDKNQSIMNIIKEWIDVEIVMRSIFKLHPEYVNFAKACYKYKIARQLLRMRLGDEGLE